MFECKFKYELEDSLVSAKYVYKSQKRKQDKFIAILIPILLCLMIAMIVYDIIVGNSFVWDLILIIALVVLESLYLVIPIMLVKSQKKTFYKNKVDETDYMLIKIDDSTCVETLFKEEQEISKNIHALKQLTSYLEDGNRLILVFNNVEYVCLRKNAITGDIEKLKTHLNKIMSKVANGKK